MPIALLIAGRIHGFRRTQREVVQTVRICDSTLRNRLMEFSQTPASMLTPMQFAHEIEEETTQECDPPAFVRSIETKDGESKEGVEDQASLDREMMRALTSSEIISTFGKDGVEDDSQMAQGGKGEHEKDKAIPNEVDGDDIGDEGYLKEEELDAYLCQTEEEVEQRRRIWREMNRDYLMEQEAKQRKKMTDDRQASSASLEGPLPESRTDPISSSSNPIRPRSVTARSTLEAVQGMMEKKKLSKHIDQSTFHDIFGADVSQFDSSQKEGEEGSAHVTSEMKTGDHDDGEENEMEEEEDDDDENDMEEEEGAGQLANEKG
jgi:transcription factor IIIB 90 kDa subunit